MMNIRRFYKPITLAILLSLAAPVFAAPRSYSAWGNASTAAASATFSFNPKSFCFANDSTVAAEIIYINWQTTAAAVSGAANIRILASEMYCSTFQDTNVTNTFVVSFISASGTPAYRVFGNAR